jgi:hypothetical protein
LKSLNTGFLDMYYKYFKSGIIYVEN